MQEVKRHRGLRVDPAALDRELAARGLQGRDLAKLAGLDEDTISRLRQGRRADRKTMFLIVAALEKVPTNPLLAALAGVAR